MRKPICWTERLEDGIKREIRVTFPGETFIEWAFYRSDQTGPDRMAVPTLEHWEQLLILAERWYQRRRLPFKNLEMIRKRTAAVRCSPDADTRR